MIGWWIGGQKDRRWQAARRVHYEDLLWNILNISQEKSSVFVGWTEQYDTDTGVTVTIRCTKESSLNCCQLIINGCTSHVSTTGATRSLSFFNSSINHKESPPLSTVSVLIFYHAYCSADCLWPHFEVVHASGSNLFFSACSKTFIYFKTHSQWQNKTTCWNINSLYFENITWYIFHRHTYLEILQTFWTVTFRIFFFAKVITDLDINHSVYMSSLFWPQFLLFFVFRKKHQ